MITKYVGTGGDYADWDAALTANTNWTDNIDFIQVSDFSMNSSFAVPASNGFTGRLLNPNGYTTTLNPSQGLYLRLQYSGTGTLLANGLIINNGTGAHLGSNNSAAPDILIEMINCIVYNSSQDGITCIDNRPPIRIISCKIFGCQRHGLYLNPTSSDVIKPADGVKFVENCTISDCSDCGVYVSDSDNVKFTIKNTVSVRNVSSDWFSNGTTYNSFIECRDEDGTLGAQGERITPATAFLSIDTANENYLKINQSSELFGVGDITLLAENTTDIDGNPRPNGGGTVSIGCYEPVYIPPAPAPTPTQSHSRKESILYIRSKEASAGIEDLFDFFRAQSCIGTKPPSAVQLESNLAKLGRGEHGTASEVQAIYSPFSIKCQLLSEFLYFMSFFMGKEDSILTVDVPNGIFSHQLDHLAVSGRSVPTFSMLYYDGTHTHLCTHCIVTDFAATLSGAGDGVIEAVFNGVCNMHYSYYGTLTKQATTAAWSAGNYDTIIAEESLINYVGCRIYNGTATATIPLVQSAITFGSTNLTSALDVSPLINSITVSGANGMTAEETMRAGGDGIVNDQNRKDFTFDLEIETRKNVVPIVSASTYKQTVIDRGPISYWRLGEASGTTAVDEMEVQDGTYTNSPTLGVTGNPYVGDSDTAVSLNGVNQYINVPHQNDYQGMSTLLIEGWFKIDTLTTGRYHIITKWGAGDFGGLGEPDDYYSVEVRNLGITAEIGNGTVSKRFNSTLQVVQGTWYYVIYLFKNSTLKVYLNGVEYINQSVGFATINNNALNIPINIGAQAAHGVYANAIIDEVAIYDYDWYTDLTNKDWYNYLSSYNTGYPDYDDYLLNDTRRAVEINWQGKRIADQLRYGLTMILPSVQLYSVVEDDGFPVAQKLHYKVFTDSSNTAFKVVGQNCIGIRMNGSHGAAGEASSSQSASPSSTSQGYSSSSSE